MAEVDNAGPMIKARDIIDEGDIRRLIAVAFSAAW